jgi:FlxA-like protein
MIYATPSSSTSLDTASGERAPADLQAQLEKMRNQLQDRSAQRSANTTEGKAKIREVSRKVDAIQQRIHQVQLDRVQTEAPPQRARLDPAAVLGGRVDVYV